MKQKNLILLIAKQLDGIDKDDLKQAEKNIARLLVEAGVFKGNSDERYSLTPACVSSYSSHRGRCVGRVCHALCVYTRRFDIDHAQVGTGSVTIHGKVFATYIWPGEKLGDLQKGMLAIDKPADDTPIIYFEESEAKKEYVKNQYIAAQFLDDPNALDNIYYAVQQLRHVLSLQDALWIKWLRDEQQSAWDAVCPPNEIKTKIVNSLRKNIKRMTPAWYEEHWQHFAMCAIWEI